MPTKRDLEHELDLLKKRLEENEKLVRAAIKRLEKLGATDLALAVTKAEIAKTRAKKPH